MAITKPALWTMPGPETQLVTPGAERDAQQAERTAIFDRIKPAGNWKEAISARIDPAEFDDCDQACIWFTGSTLTREAMTADGKLWVTAPGYYATIGA